MVMHKEQQLNLLNLLMKTIKNGFLTTVVAAIHGLSQQAKRKLSLKYGVAEPAADLAVAVHKAELADLADTQCTK